MSCLHSFDSTELHTNTVGTSFDSTKQILHSFVLDLQMGAKAPICTRSLRFLRKARILELKLSTSELKSRISELKPRISELKPRISELKPS